MAINEQPVAIAVFAKAPIPGQAKTRLIPSLGAVAAAQLQRRLLKRTLETALAAGLGPVSLWCTPSCDHPVFRAHQDTLGLALHAQEGADLGARMLQGFSTLCREQPALLIGTDCPALTVAALRSAASALREGKDAVVLPAEDGGYVLLGLRRADPLLFDNLPWGSEQVMAQTRERLSQLGWRWSEPALLWDVDRPEDLERLRASGLLADWFREFTA